MKAKIYLKEDLLSKKIFGISLIIFGFVSIFYGKSKSVSIAIVTIFLGCSFISYRGLEIDPEKKIVREFVSFLGIKLGSWVTFENPDYVSVFKMKFTDRRGNKTGEILKINLFFPDNKHLTLYETGNLEEAFEVANFIKSTLNINVLDATNNESNWI